MKRNPVIPIPGSPAPRQHHLYSTVSFALERFQMPNVLISTRLRHARRTTLILGSALFWAATLLAFPSLAMDLVTFAGITGPMTGALTTISTITPGVKAIVGVVGFIAAFIALTALRSFGPVLYYVGLAIFGSVGLVVAGGIMGAVI